MTDEGTKEIWNCNFVIERMCIFMKKIFSIIVVCLMMVSMVACGSSSASSAKPTATQAKGGVASPVTTQTEVKALEIKDSAWVVNSGYLFCYIDMFNPNEDVAIQLPSYRVTARGDNNEILGTQDHTLSVINPQQHFIYGGMFFSVSKNPKTVEVQPLEAKDYNIKKNGEFEEYKPLEVVNYAQGKEKITGEINNPNDYSINQSVVVALCRNDKGELEDIEMTFVNSISAGGSIPFEISMFGNKKKYPDIKVYADRWS